MINPEQLYGEDFGSNFEESDRTIEGLPPDDLSSLGENGDDNPSSPKIILNSCRKKDINAYVSPVDRRGKIIDYQDNNYGKPLTEEEIKTLCKS